MKRSIIAKTEECWNCSANILLGAKYCGDNCEEHHYWILYEHDYYPSLDEDQW